jgi:hypothetical protein
MEKLLDRRTNMGKGVGDKKKMKYLTLFSNIGMKFKFQGWNFIRMEGCKPQEFNNNNNNNNNNKW